MSNTSRKQVVLITGATSGLGRAMGEVFSRKGYITYGTSRHPEKNSTAFPLLKLDLRDHTSIADAVQHVIEREGRIDVLINNAGVGIAGPLEELPEQDMIQVLQTNLLGLARTMQLVLPVMRRQGEGKIINISSVASEVALPYRSMYSASKAAVNRMTESLRMEVAPFGIQATSILAGDMRTPINQNRLMSVPPDDSVYREVFHRAATAMNDEVDRGVDPYQIANRIEALIHKRRLKKLYTMGKPLQQLAVFLARAMPGNLFERLLRTYSKV